MANYFKLIIGSLLFISPTVYGETMDKFDWQASECAPKGYPMQIISGSLIYPDGGSLYVPDKKTLHHGWGTGRSSHLVGPDLKPLPNQLAISFFSYTENQFYSGRFDLPYEKVVKMFNTGYYSPKEGQHITYGQIVVGIAPGGVVSVWLAGNDKTTEVFFGQAEKEAGEWHWINDNPKYSREEYVRLEIQDTLSLEATTVLKKNGIPFGRWEGYHQKRYQWQPLVTGFQLRDDLIKRVKYFNGENEYLYYPLEDAAAESLRAVPQEIIFVWLRPKKTNLVYKLYFEETEIFELFEKLGGKKQPLQLEMRMVDTDKGLQLGVLLRNKDEGTYLRHVTLKKYTALR